MKFSDLITTEEQYEVNKARAGFSLFTNILVERLTDDLNYYFPSHSVKVR